MSIFDLLFGRNLSPLTDYKTGSFDDRLLDALDSSPPSRFLGKDMKTQVGTVHTATVKELTDALGCDRKVIYARLRKLQNRNLAAVYWIHDPSDKRDKLVATSDWDTMKFLAQRAKQWQ